MAPAAPEPSPAEWVRARRVAIARDALAAKARPNAALLLVVSLAAFVWWALQDGSLRTVGVLVAVVLFHECGHLVVMRLRGFADLRMFFLPFFGAAVSGRKPGASAVDHALVALAGPVPGLMVALALAARLPAMEARDHLARTVPDMSLATELVLMLVILNVLNLAPMLPFDGGRLFEAILFGRWPLVDLAFRGAAIAALALLAWQASFEMAGVIAALFALGLPNHARMAFAAQRLLRTRALPADPNVLTDDDLVALHDAADAATPPSHTHRARLLATNVVQIFDRVARRPATCLQTTVLVLLWLLALAAGAAALVVLARNTLR
jgi:Zn-dependent protease